MSPGPGHTEVSGDPEDSGLGGEKGPDTYVDWTEGEERAGVRVHCLATYSAVQEGRVEDGGGHGATERIIKGGRREKSLGVVR